MATGRCPNTADLGLDIAGVALDERGAVTVDGRPADHQLASVGRRGRPGAPQFVYVSVYHGALAAENGYEVRVAVLPISAVPRGLVAREAHGLVKLVADAGTDRLLGASVLAPGAGDVIQSAVLAIRHGITTAELAATFHPYLTMAESLRRAAQSFTCDVATLSCCAH